jgi:hypothetical protein
MTDMEALQPHQERVVAESNELRGRLMKLAAFIDCNEAFKALDWDDRELLRDQREVMGEYLSILERRIARF